jgi:hypothetical protein
VINGKQVYPGAFAKEEDAARAYNEFVQHGTCNVVPKQEGSSSKFRGVCWRKNANKWVAQRVVNGKKVYLRYYAKEEDAARAYNDFVQHGTRNVVPKQTEPTSKFSGVCWLVQPIEQVARHTLDQQEVHFSRVLCEGGGGGGGVRRLRAARHPQRQGGILFPLSLRLLEQSS